MARPIALVAGDFMTTELEKRLGIGITKLKLELGASARRASLHHEMCQSLVRASMVVSSVSVNAAQC